MMVMEDIIDLLNLQHPQGKRAYYIYNGRKYSIIMNRVLVFPQAYTAIIPQNRMILGTSNIFIVDIGGNTTDVLLLQNGMLDLRYCMSLETGIITMNNEIARKVGTYHDMRIEDEHISAVLRGESMILPEDVKDMIHAGAFCFVLYWKSLLL